MIAIRDIPAKVTFGAAMAAHRGVGPGFDLLRLLLALAIFYGHGKWIAGQAGLPLFQAADPAAIHPGPAPGPHGGLLRPIQLALVPMFFALSGYLVMGSAARLRATSTFLAHRALRIFPALVVEVVLSALVLGPVLTTLPLSEYLASPRFWAYFGNAVGRVSFDLPGVFLANPARDVVNVNLWTLPAEFYCYVITAAGMALGLLYDRRAFSAACLLVFLALAVAHALTGMSSPEVPFPGHVVVLYFVGGLLFHHWQDRIPASPVLFAACLPLAYLALANDATIYAAMAPLIYATLYLGLLPVPRLGWLAGGDYSYGLYLYGFPISQALVALFPKTFIGHLPILLLVATPCTALFAVLSWHAIEKHALGLKGRLPLRWFPRRRREQAFAAAAARTGA